MQSDRELVRLEDYQPTPYLIDQVDLTIQLHPTAAKITSILTISPRATFDSPKPLVLDGDALTLVSAKLNGSELDEQAFDADAKSFILKQPPQETFTLELVTQVDPQANTQLEGLYRSSDTYCTQCEAEGFRRITYFYDRPDCLSIYSVRIEAEKAGNPHLLSNGNLITSGEMDTPDGQAEGGAWHFAQWHDPFPKPSYLFAMVAGDLTCMTDSFTTMSGREVALHIYVEHGKEDRVDYAMDSLKRSMKWDEEVFGREYDLDIFMIVAVSDFNMGAMENKGLNIFNDKFILAKPETATDTDYALIEAIIAHEYFHNWTGNRITCRDWFQLCLKEGLTVFRDQEFSADMRSRPVKRISDVRQLKARQFPEDGGPLAHPVRPQTYSEINNFYTATVYEKGAELCRMIHTILGEDQFRKGMDVYFDRHDGDASTIEDFLKAFEDASGKDLSQFALWYSQAGTPDLVTTYSYAPQRQELVLSIEQSCPPTPGQPTKKVMHIPVRFGLVARDGGDVSYQSIRDDRTGKPVSIDPKDPVLHITERQNRFVFTGVASPAIPSLLQGFSSPVHLRSNLTLDDQLILMRNDSDPFNRWQSTQFVYMEHLTKRSRALQKPDANTAPVVPQGLIDALAHSASDRGLEPAFLAQLLTLPSEDDIARELGRDVDPDAIHDALGGFKQDLAQALKPALIDLYQSHTAEGPYSPDAQSAGLRALRNVVLSLLQSLNEAEMFALAATQYEQASNMTDRFAALSSLVHGQAPQAQSLLDDFHDRFAGDALIIDKWLSLQAMTSDDSTLQRVRSLMNHDTFSMTNPNRVRSLIGAFAMGNAAQFNRADGQGYELVADVILELDQTNPQTAARLLNNFRSWRVLEPGRQEKAKLQLERIARQKPLSKDVSDIANRCLQ